MFWILRGIDTANKAMLTGRGAKAAEFRNLARRPGTRTQAPAGAARTFFRSGKGWHCPATRNERQGAISRACGALANATYPARTSAAADALQPSCKRVAGLKVAIEQGDVRKALQSLGIVQQALGFRNTPKTA